MKYYKIWLPLLSIVVFFGTVELISRCFSLTDKLDTDFKFYIRNVHDDLKIDYNVEDAILMWSLKPDYSDTKIAINSQGFRDREYAFKKDKYIFRILCLGDSSTFGFQVPLQETYHRLLEDSLNNNIGYSRGIQFEVINAGVTGYSSCQGLALYKYKGYKYNPDIVTFYFGINDLVREFYLSDKEIMRPDVPVAFKILTNKILLNLDSYRIMRKLVMDVTSRGKNKPKENVPRVPVEDFKENILELNRLCRENGSSLLLISPPLRKECSLKVDLQRRKDLIPYIKALENVSRQNNIPLITIKEMSPESPSDAKQFFIDPIHPNSLGHWMIMKNVYDYIVTNKLSS